MGIIILSTSKGLMTDRQARLPVLVVKLYVRFGKLKDFILLSCW